MYAGLAVQIFAKNWLSAPDARGVSNALKVVDMLAAGLRRLKTKVLPVFLLVLMTLASFGDKLSLFDGFTTEIRIDMNVQIRMRIVLNIGETDYSMCTRHAQFAVTQVAH